MPNDQPERPMDSDNHVPIPFAPSTADLAPGVIVRRARRAQGLTLAELGTLTGYSAAQVSRFERGLAPMTDITVLRRFAAALRISPQVFGLTEQPPHHGQRHSHVIGVANPYPCLPPPRVSGKPPWEDGDDPVRRRRVLAHLTATAAAVANSYVPVGRTTQADEVAPGDLLIGGVRDAMLGLGPVSTPVPADRVRAEITYALTDFDACRYGRLAHRLPWLIRAVHALTADGDTPQHHTLLAKVYLLTTRVLIKLDDQQLAWMAADRTRVTADISGDALTAAEAARNLAVLARRAGWYAQALSIALTAADVPGLRNGERACAAERGLLIQSAAYTAARSGDRSGMRQLTDHAAAITIELGGRTWLPDHGGGFSIATVQLHRISAENSLGDPAAALTAARALTPAHLPTVERRARYYTDIAAAFGRWGRRDECLRALLAAEHHAPEETHSRPAVRALVSGLLVSGRTTPELRGLATRCSIR
jgi:hypothetical protein